MVASPRFNVPVSGTIFQGIVIIPLATARFLALGLMIHAQS